jgi:hypothetical protein
MSDKRADERCGHCFDGFYILGKEWVACEYCKGTDLNELGKLRRENAELRRKVEAAKERAYAAEQRADRMIDHHVLECRKLEIENADLRRKVEAVEEHWLYPAMSMSMEPPWCNGANGTWHVTRELARASMWASFSVTPEPCEPRQSGDRPE